MEAPRLDPGYWLAQTKLQPPPLPADAITRPRLLGALCEALLSTRLTLVSAPPGYGKTTLLGALPAVLPDLPLAWLSLDEEDGDPARFLAALILAVRQPFPNFGVAALSLLAGLRGPGLEARYVVGSLVNELLEVASNGCLLVLDDLHVISDPAAYLALDYLLERIPPDVHVAIATRHDPPLALARLRARGHMAELRLADVRFTLQEAAELLNDRLRLGLGDKELDRLYERTEGWPAGLRLLASSLERMPTSVERSSFIAGLLKRDRYLFDYLAAEVLDRQEPSLRRFLLETSILPELTPDVCRAVTGREDAETALKSIDRRGLFVVPDGVPGSSLRYHALFAEFLRGRLEQEMPERVAELHERAARATLVPGRAIAHYLAAGRPREAAQLVETEALQLFPNGLVGTVAAWLQALPGEVRLDHPRLILLDGLCAFDRGDFARARATLEAAIPALERVADEEGVGLALSHLATCALLQMDLRTAGALVEHALPRPMGPAQRLQLLMTRCWVNMFQGAWAEASADLADGMALVEAALSPEVLVVMAHNTRADLTTLPGGAAQMERFLRLASPLVEKGVTPFGVAVEELAAYLHSLRGRLDQALETSERVVDHIQQLGGYPHLGMVAAGTGAVVHMARGDYPSAERLLAVLHKALLASPVGQASEVVGLYLLGRLRLLQGDLAGARHVAEQTLVVPGLPESPENEVLRLKLRALLAMAEKRFAEAERLLRQAVELEHMVPLAALFGTSRVLLARLAYERGQPKAAVEEIAPVLEECQREDRPGLILMDGREAVPVLQLVARGKVHAAYARWLLSLLEPAAAAHPLATVPETGEVLSPRELEVLGLMADGASNRAIAEVLVIGEATVKSHVISILRKLNVSSRTQAAARARELGLPR